MKADKIIVKPFSYISFMDIEILQEINEHGKARIKGVLDKNTDEKLLENLPVDETVTIYAMQEDEISEILFQGVLCQASYSVENGIKILEIYVVTYSYFMDLKENTRIFQNGKRTFSELAKWIGKENGAGVICTEGKQQEIGQIMVQYQETDWAFLKRIASKINTFLVADHLNAKPSLSFGPVKPKRREIHDFSCTMVRNLSEYYLRQNQEGTVCREQDVLSYRVTTREILRLCTPVLFNEKEYYVKSVRMELLGSELVNVYELAVEGGLRTTEAENKKISGLSIDGKIHQVKQDRVQVSFLQDVDAPCIWFPYATAYSSPDGAGWYCMPEIGDAVRIYFPDSKENHALAINMVHLTCDLREDPKIKYIRSPHNKEIRFEPGAIYITNHQGMMVCLDDKRGVSINSNKDIVIMAGENIDLHSEKEIRISGDEGVIARQGDNRIEIKDGIKQIARMIAQK
ncbi:phage baseplate assembly protein V [Thomasclavelia cocleata]|jgi:hypothetical protein|uniref:phage baseplate assembly protein V n=1 Tax=Thomasclavelia cocleata TaxID=69824 RepID=UPI002558361E|nr:phage baseplate assembly protein V [Thomasclavelia cocleata]